MTVEVGKYLSKLYHTPLETRKAKIRPGISIFKPFLEILRTSDDVVLTHLIMLLRLRHVQPRPASARISNSTT